MKRKIIIIAAALIIVILMYSCAQMSTFQCMAPMIKDSDKDKNVDFRPGYPPRKPEKEDDF